MMIGNEDQEDFWTAEAGWRERERRQRSVRFLIMFLLMLLLMDGEEQAQRRRSHGNLRPRKKSNSEAGQELEKSLYLDRKEQDALIEKTVKSHPRYQRLVEKNNGIDFDSEVRKWAEQHEKDEFAKDEFAPDEVDAQVSLTLTDPEEERKVLHYPWNATGFYRGEWFRDDTQGNNKLELTSEKVAGAEAEMQRLPPMPPKVMTAFELEKPMLNALRDRGESLGVYLLPQGIELHLPNSSIPSNLERAKSDSSPMRSQQSIFLRGTPDFTSQDSQLKKLQVTLTKEYGRVAFQLYSRSVPAIKELSILDGFIKLYDSNTVGYSTRRDILLRVNGIILHSLGKISLISNVAPERSALVIGPVEVSEQSSPAEVSQQRRRLHESLASDISNERIKQIRDDALALFKSKDLDFDSTFSSGKINSKEFESLTKESNRKEGFQDGLSRRRLTTWESSNDNLSQNLSPPKEANTDTTSEIEPMSSKYIVPYPFVADDQNQSIQNARTPAARSMPLREQLLEANAGSCEFEISMNVQEEEWTVGEWRSLLSRHFNEAPQLERGKGLTESNQKVEPQDRTKNPGGRSLRPVQDQSLVMKMDGSIYSPNCNFAASLNATAIRTDWEDTSGKAINYSFYMMLTCLTQIVLLLKQLLHTQAQSAATRVSLLCVGWQAVLDALLCLAHIYMSLAMQPLFTAFASVAFFKLLIFCVIEMKYMAIIIQARNSSNGGNTTELLRRQIAMLHLRFYVALIGAFLASFYTWDSYRTLYILALYSFWVPQIIQNVVTQAKRPLHRYYVYGMSLTRLVAPLYIFAVKNNFLKEVYPDSPTSITMCEVLIVWVGIQTAVLEAQGRYGARFMIPARFLPPKFDYSRPIPASLLPAETLPISPSEALQNERGRQTEIRSLVSKDSSPHRAGGGGGGARNRIKGSRANRNENSMTSETVSTTSSDPSMPSFECVICYNEIDVRNPRGYMLGPCDHLFHRDCLVQWMEVKMECPICRTELPAL